MEIWFFDPFGVNSAFEDVHCCVAMLVGVGVLVGLLVWFFSCLSHSGVLSLGFLVFLHWGVVDVVRRSTFVVVGFEHGLSQKGKII